MQTRKTQNVEKLGTSTSPSRSMWGMDVSCHCLRDVAFHFEVRSVLACMCTYIGRFAAMLLAAQAPLHAQDSSVLPSKLESAPIRGGVVGMKLVTINGSEVKRWGVDFPSIVLVYDVALNFPAEKAGLMAGDIIKSIDGIIVNKESDVTDRISQSTPGSKFRLTIIRSGKENNVYIESVPFSEGASLEWDDEKFTMAYARRTWGAFAEHLLVRNKENKFVWIPKDYRVVAGKPGEERRVTIEAIRWESAPDGNIIMKQFSVAEDGRWMGWWMWKFDVPSGSIRRTYTDRGPYERFTISPDGLLSGRYASYQGGASSLPFGTFIKSGAALEFIQTDKSGSIKWHLRMEEVPIGAYKNAADRYWQQEVARKKEGAEGSGIGVMLAGALIGGALTDGSPEGIMAGAQAMAPSEETRAQLADTNAEVAARERAQDADSAAFRARIANTVRANQPASTGGSASTPRGGMGGMGGISRTEAPRMTPQQQAQFDELERIKMREQTARGERPTTIAEDAQARMAGPTSTAGQRRDQSGSGSASTVPENRITYVACVGSQRATVFRPGKDQSGNQEVLRFMFVHYTSRIGKISSKPGYGETLGRLSDQFRSQLPSIEAPDRYVSSRGGYCFEDPSYDQIVMDIEENKRVWERDLGGKSSRDLISYENVYWTPGD